MINDKFQYVGVFFEADYFMNEISKICDNHLFRVIQNPHITFAYKPSTIDESLFGERVVVKMVAYGNNGINEGVKVELVSANEAVRTAFSQIEIPHITISVSESGKPVNTRYLDFSQIEPIEIEGIYGGWEKNIENKI